MKLRHRMLIDACVLIAAALGVGAATARAADAAPPPTANSAAGGACEPGAYRSDDGDLLAIVRTPTKVAYTFIHGQRGDIAAKDSPVHCVDAAITTTDGRKWNKLAFLSTEVNFTSHGTALHGVLLRPQAPNKTPLVVLVHGSERTSPNGSSVQQLLTAQGVATFAYDKRGTGRSHGVYTQDFVLLADDAAAAVAAARSACPKCFQRVGLHGGSQGGWIAPLAAIKSKADFVEVGFGVVGSPLEQDIWQVDYELRDAGFAPDAAVHAVTAATAAIAASDFTEGLDELNAIRRRYGAEPWFSRLSGQYTGELVRGEIERAREESPAVPWHYDSIDVLRRLRIPQLWVFAQEDSIAPSAPSIARLEDLRRHGLDAAIVVYPQTDHGIATYIRDASGQRRRTGLADGYLQLLADWAKGTVKGPYGDANWVAGGAK